MFAVIRVEKRKGAAISAIEKHNSRTIEILPDGKEKNLLGTNSRVFFHV